MAGQRQDKKIEFTTVQLFKDQILGIGSYGKVCKAECDGLLCAAKIIHETLFDPTSQKLMAPPREHRLPMRRFEQECEFLSTIRHPNIIQYLGMYQDPDTSLPVLLMELMDNNLTQFLESSPQPIPYHIQVNICLDIALALRFLHSNGIVHRDLSSNNVLMIGNIRAKVTDFGMAKLGDMNPRATHLTFTMCPGTDVFMPPEAVKDKPVYTEKIDCFSFGVLAVQIMTRLFPQPGDRRKEIEIEHVGVVEKRISEQERRQNHISKVDPSHPLLLVALSCLKDRDVERPSAGKLCSNVASLKQHQKYSESVSKGEGKSCEITQRKESLQHAQQIEGLQNIIQSQDVHLKEKDQVIMQQDEAIATGLQEIQQLREQLEQLRKQVHQVKDERNRKDSEILRLTTQLEHANSQMRIYESQLQLGKKDQSKEVKSKVSNGAGGMVNDLKLKWREGKKTPCKISNNYIGEMAATVYWNYVYVVNSTQIYAYNASTCAWLQLPESKYRGCALAIVNNLLTLIGGKNHSSITNKLFSLHRHVAEWTEEFPSMPTSRWGASALCTGTAVIVAGGQGNNILGTVTEVLNTATLQWTVTVDLPQPLFGGSLVRVSSELIYILGGYDNANRPVRSAYICSLSALFQSCISPSLGTVFVRPLSLLSIWRRVTDIPSIDSAYVSFQGRLLAIGGRTQTIGQPLLFTCTIHP